MKQQPRILFWDIETSLCKYAAFGPKNDYLPYTALLEDWHILTISYMFEGDKKPKNLRIKKYGDDKELVKAMREILLEADVVVHHNGDVFDLKKFTARLIKHRLPPLPKIKSIDTKKMWKKIADSNYAHLDYLASFMQLEGKTKDVGGLWMRLLKGDMTALEPMAKYNDKDVIVLRNVFQTMLPYMTGLPSFREGRVCQSCDSDSLQSRGSYTTAAGVVYTRYCCRNCGKWSRDTQSKGRVTTIKSL